MSQGGCYATSFFYIIEVSTFFIMATHAPRNTTTGNKKELELEVFLNENYSGNVYPQAVVGKQFTTNKNHVVDILIGGDAYKKTRKQKGGHQDTKVANL